MQRDFFDLKDFIANRIKWLNRRSETSEKDISREEMFCSVVSGSGLYSLDPACACDSKKGDLPWHTNHFPWSLQEEH